MPDWIVAVLLGVVEGVTEFLPVSSTGHLLIAEHWLPKQSEVFNIVIQGGAALALFGVFGTRLRQMLATWREPATRDYVLKLLLAFFVTGVGGLVLKKLGLKLTDQVVPVASATLIGGVLFLAVEQWLRQRPLAGAVTWRIAVAAGLAQLIAAVFPGTSRSGITILAALVLGLNRSAAAEFSFLLGIPTLLAAGALQTLSALKHSGGAPERWDLIAVGTVAAAVTAFGVVKWLLRFVQTHTFVGFAWYRIALGLLLLAFVNDAAPEARKISRTSTNAVITAPVTVPAPGK